MSKRPTATQFAEPANQWFPTPAGPVAVLLPHLAPGTRFAEPCAGDGALLDQLEAAGHRCVAAFDLAPKRDDIVRADARGPLPWVDRQVDALITNPPWKPREVLHAILANCIAHGPTWSLHDADWMHTTQAAVAVRHGVPTTAELLRHCRKVVSVGRVKWFPGTRHQGFDNCCWYYFDQCGEGPPAFIGRDSECAPTTPEGANP